MSKSAVSPCCPEFQPQLWDGKTHLWQDKAFITDNVAQIFHIPLNVGGVIKRMWKKVTDADAALPMEESLILFRDCSLWKSELFMSVAREVPDAKNVKFTGEFISKVYTGPYHAVPKWIADMDKSLAGQGKKSLKYFIHYAYCPKCAKHYGVNYAAAFAQVK